MTITVTQEHIDKGREKLNSGIYIVESCPIALAAGDAGLSNVQVGTS